MCTLLVLQNMTGRVVLYFIEGVNVRKLKKNTVTMTLLVLQNMTGRVVLYFIEGVNVRKLKKIR